MQLSVVSCRLNRINRGGQGPWLGDLAEVGLQLGLVPPGTRMS